MTESLIGDRIDIANVNCKTALPAPPGAKRPSAGLSNSPIRPCRHLNP